MALSKSVDAVKTKEIPFWHIKYKGVVLPAYMSTEGLDDMKDNNIQETDIFIASYPKSGSTWMKTILIHLLERKDVIPPSKNGDYQGVSAKAPMYCACSERFLDTLPSPRLFKEHVMFEIMPDQFKAKPPKVIYLVRNPKDVVVSYLHHMTLFKIDEFEGDMDTMVRLFCEGNAQFGSWSDHIKSWCFGNIPSNNLLVISYEDMVVDCETQINRVTKFLNLNIEHEKIHKIVDECQFNSMKAKDLPDVPGCPSFIKKDFLVDENKHFLREGKVGSWKRHLTVQQSENLDNFYNPLKSSLTQKGINVQFEI